MKTMLLLTATFLYATTALAIIDPEADKTGFYFDVVADQNEYDATANLPFLVYLVLTNTSHPEISGYEAGYTIVVPAGHEDDIFHLQGEFLGGIQLPPCPDLTCDVELVLSVPYPTSPAIVVGTILMMLLDEFPVDLYLHGSSDPEFDDGLPAVLSGGTWHPLGVTRACNFSGDAYPSAIINTLCGVPEEKTTWGQVKAVYR